MAYLEWSDYLSVKVREIDEQHKGLISIINRLHEAMIENHGRELQEEIVAETLKYAAVHFATEEQYMLKFGFPGYTEHKKEHEEFTVEVQELKMRLESGVLILSIEILTLLKEWLQNHILGTDMKYADFFNSNGLA